MQVFIKKDCDLGFFLSFFIFPFGIVKWNHVVLIIVDKVEGLGWIVSLMRGVLMGGSDTETFFQDFKKFKIFHKIRII